MTAAQGARAIKAAQDLPLIEVDLRGEIFQGSSPVLVGIDAASTHCYLPALAEHRDGYTWGCHILDAVAQGLAQERIIADFGTGLRAGHQEVFGEEVPCHGDVFHLQHQCQGVVNSLNRQAMGATTQRQTLEQEMAKVKLKEQGNRISTKLTQARQAESIAISLSRDVKTLIQWLNHDVLELAGTKLIERQELYDFVVTELKLREGIGRKKGVRYARRSRISATIFWALHKCLTTSLRRSPRSWICRCMGCGRYVCFSGSSPHPKPTGKSGIICTRSCRGSSIHSMKRLRRQST